MSGVPVRFYIGYVLAVLLVVGVVEVVFGTLYARYVIIYTSGIFMGGLLIGQRYEQLWLARQRRLQGAGVAMRSEASSGPVGGEAAGSRMRQAL